MTTTTNRRRRAGAALLAALSLTAACAGADELTGDIVADDSIASDVADLTLDGCTTTYANHATVLAGDFKHVVSSSGHYFYGRKDLCNRFVVDFHVGSFTTEHFAITASAYDTPGSKGFGDRLPGNAEDCAHWSESVRFYKRPSGSTQAFTFLGSRSYKGAWKNGLCTPTATSGALEALDVGPQSTSTTYRVAVGTKLRGTWQGVQVGAAPVPQ